MEDRNRAWVEVRTSSIVENYRRIEAAAGEGVRLVPMVKADGYGLGAVPLCRLLGPLRPAAYGVAAVSAGTDLRRAGFEERIIVFTPLAPGDEGAAAAAGLEVVVGDVDSIRRARVAGLEFHLELDTGMGRAGWPEQATEAASNDLRAALRAGPGWKGLYTHLHSADEAGAPGVEGQLAVFASLVESLDPPPAVELHAANSAGAFLGPVRTCLADLSSRFGGPVLVRPGIHLYGGGPGPDLPTASPVVSLRARIVRIADVEPGTTAGYSAEYRASRPERWATLAVGYGDGLSRRFFPGGEVLIAGARVPVVGRISMDMTVANISGLDGVRTGDVATLIGRDGDLEITIDDMAAMTGTISYEVLTGLAPRLPRIWEGGE